MDKNFLEKFEKSRVKIFCRGGAVWTGQILTLSSDCLFFRDKYNCEVVINYSSIDSVSLVQELPEVTE